MSDEEFVKAFESCELSPDLFHHADHIRLARIYLDQYGLEAATARFVEYLKKFAAHIGKSSLYHETLTVAWMRLVASVTPGNFSTLLDKKYMENFYSPELLATDAARAQFVEPDRAPLPPAVPPK
jgi:hypothetical protein